MGMRLLTIALTAAALLVAAVPAVRAEVLADDGSGQPCVARFGEGDDEVWRDPRYVTWGYHSAPLSTWEEARQVGGWVYTIWRRWNALFGGDPPANCSTRSRPERRTTSPRARGGKKRRRNGDDTRR
jgi:hypothetical protein